MKKVSNLILFVISLLIINLGLLTVCLYIYDPIAAQGFQVLVIAVDDKFQEEPGFNEEFSSKHKTTSNFNRTAEAIKLIIDWANKNSTTVYIVPESFYDKATYFFAEDNILNDNHLYANSADLYERLHGAGIEDIQYIDSQNPNSPFNLPFIDTDLLIPLSKLETLSGFIYVKNNDERIVELQKELENVGYHFAHEVEEAFSGNILASIISLYDYDILGRSILLGIVVLILFVIYTFLVYMHYLQKEFKVHRQFGLSKSRFAIMVAISISIVICLTMFISCLMSFWLFKNIGISYVLESLSLLLIIDVLIVLISFCIFGFRSSLGVRNE